MSLMPFEVRSSLLFLCVTKVFSFLVSSHNFPSDPSYTLPIKSPFWHSPSKSRTFISHLPASRLSFQFILQIAVRMIRLKCKSCYSASVALLFPWDKNPNCSAWHLSSFHNLCSNHTNYRWWSQWADVSKGHLSQSFTSKRCLVISYDTKFWKKVYGLSLHF